MRCGITKVNSALSQRVNSVRGRLIIFRGPSGTRWKNIDFGEFLRSAHGGYHGFAPGLPCCIRQPTKSHHHYQHHHNNYGTNIATIGSSNKCYTHQNIKASTAVFLTALVGCVNIWITELGKGSTEKNVFFRALPEWWGGGLPMPEFFGPLSLFRSAFLVNKKRLFLQKCQCIEVLTVF